MRKRVVIINEDHFSLKKLVKGIGNGIKDTTLVLNSPMTGLGKAIGIKKEAPKASTRFAQSLSNAGNDISTVSYSPIKNMTNSVRGRAFKNDYKTGVGKAVGKVSDTSQILIDSASKGFADAVSGGGATKVKNWAFKTVDPKNKTGYQKEGAFKYGEMKPTQSSGIKLLDKASGYAAPIGAIAGAAYGAYSAGSSASGNKDKSNMKPNNVTIGSNVLDQQSPSPIDSGPLSMPDNGLNGGFPTGVQSGDIPGTENNGLDNTKMASFISGFSLNPISIGIIIIVIILLIVAVKHKNA